MSSGYFDVSCRAILGDSQELTASTLLSFMKKMNISGPLVTLSNCEDIIKKLRAKNGIDKSPSDACIDFEKLTKALEAVAEDSKFSTASCLKEFWLNVDISTTSIAEIVTTSQGPSDLNDAELLELKKYIESKYVK